MLSRRMQARGFRAFRCSLRYLQCRLYSTCCIYSRARSAAGQRAAAVAATSGLLKQGQDQQQAAALPKAAQMHAVVAAASSGAPAYSTDTNLELAVLASEAAVDFTAAVNPADSSTELAAYNLPPPPSSNQLGSLDLCISMLQHYITPDTTWPPAALQHFRDFASALPNTLFLVVECGQWLDCVGSDFAGKPAITVMRVSPVKVEGDYELYIMAYKVNQDGWPTDEAFASPSAFEALTTRNRKKYHEAARVLLPLAESVPQSAATAAAAANSVTTGSAITIDPPAAAAAPVTTVIKRKGKQQQNPTLRMWLQQFYGREMKRILHYSHTAAIVQDDLRHVGESRRAGSVTHQSNSRTAGSSGIAQETVTELSLTRTSTRPRRTWSDLSQGNSSSSSSPAVTPLSSSSSSSPISLEEELAVTAAEHTAGQWPFYTYTQNWDALAQLGQTAVAAGDRSHTAMFDFANSIDMGRLQQSCDAEIFSSKPAKACEVYDLLLQIQALRQAAATRERTVAASFDIGEYNLEWLNDPVGDWAGRQPGSSIAGFSQVDTVA